MGHSVVLSEINGRVRDIWMRVLHIQNVDLESDFFSLGGDSLSISVMLHLIHEELGIELGSDTVFEDSTLGGFSGRVATEYDALKGNPAGGL